MPSGAPRRAATWKGSRFRAGKRYLAHRGLRVDVASWRRCRDRREDVRSWNPQATGTVRARPSNLPHRTLCAAPCSARTQSQAALPCLKLFLENVVALFPSLLLSLYGCQEYVHLIAKRVSRTCGGFDGAMLANCVPTL